MKRVRDGGFEKFELYGLIQELHRYHFSCARIGRVLGCSTEYVRRIQIDLSLRPRSMASVAEHLSWLAKVDPQLAERVCRFAQRETGKEHSHAQAA